MCPKYVHYYPFFVDHFLVIMCVYLAINIIMYYVCTSHIHLFPSIQLSPHSPLFTLHSPSLSPLPPPPPPPLPTLPVPTPFSALLFSQLLHTLTKFTNTLTHHTISYHTRLLRFSLLHDADSHNWSDHRPFSEVVILFSEVDKIFSQLV